MQTDIALFFTYWDELPANAGFSLFKQEHWLWLFSILAVIIILTVIYQKSSERTKDRMDRLTAWFMIGAILVRMCFLLVIGKQTVYELPLHLCGLAGFLCLIHAYRKWDWLSQSIYSLCLPGTLFALVFPDWTSYPAVHFISIEGFLFHGAIVLYAVCQIASGRIVPSIRKIWKAFIFLAVAAFLVGLFDIRFHVNYMFLNWPPAGSPLEWIASYLGDPGYLFGYAILVILVPIGFDLIYLLGNRKNNI